MRPATGLISGRLRPKLVNYSSAATKRVIWANQPVRLIATCCGLCTACRPLAASSLGEGDRESPGSGSFIKRAYARLVSMRVPFSAQSMIRCFNALQAQRANSPYGRYRLNAFATMLPAPSGKLRVLGAVALFEDARMEGIITRHKLGRTIRREFPATSARATAGVRGCFILGPTTNTGNASSEDGSWKL